MHDNHILLDSKDITKEKQSHNGKIMITENNLK